MSVPYPVDGPASAAGLAEQHRDRTELVAPDTVRAATEGRCVTEWLRSAGLRTVHLGLVDASGTLREKRLGRSAAARALEDGWSFIDAIQWWGPDDTLWERAGAASGHATVETDSGRPYPFAGDATFFLAEFGPPLRELSPRFQLQRMVELAASSGIGARVSWEFECILLDSSLGSSGVPQPLMAANRCWSALTMATEEEELRNLVGTLEAGAIPVDHVCAELGPGCLEIATAPEPALRAADSAALAKVYTKAYFARVGRRATFMAQLGPGFPGLGGHPSLSLHGLADDMPLLWDGPGILSKVGRWAVAGTVTLLPELLAMAAPNPNSFRRFGPGNWAPATATWGPDAYSCALRALAQNPSTARLELRVPGADTSPHHCLAMFLGAAIWGIQERLEPPPPVVPPADGRVVGRALPHDLAEAADRFEASTAAKELFGPAFVEHFARSRRAEASACHRFVSAEERDRYLDHV
jgi:glutamine synthetase